MLLNLLAKKLVTADYDHYDYNGLMKHPDLKKWTVASAKAHLSQVIEEALHEGPQTITRHGRDAVVIVSAAEWESKTKRKGSLADFFAESPLRDSGLAIERDREKPREIEL
jgi:prevent-host-death family protein